MSFWRSILIHVSFSSTHYILHTDLKDFKDVGFADYTYGDTLQGEPLHIVTA